MPLCQRWCGCRRAGTARRASQPTVSVINAMYFGLWPVPAASTRHATRRQFATYNLQSCTLPWPSTPARFMITKTDRTHAAAAAVWNADPGSDEGSELYTATADPRLY